jgi:hypothetical protein
MKRRELLTNSAVMLAAVALPTWARAQDGYEPQPSGCVSRDRQRELDPCTRRALRRFQLESPVRTLRFNAKSTLLLVLDGRLTSC